MLEVFSESGCKQLDSMTINEIGIPSMILMENAAESLCNNIDNKADSFIIICGKGNNGGDGLAIARKLYLRGKKVKVIIISNDKKYTDDFTINYNILKNILTEIEVLTTEKEIKQKLPNYICNYDIIVDCIFGVGINRDVSGIYEEVINIINTSETTVISVDVPSGMDSNTGEIKKVGVKADFTYTFEVIKKGFLNYSAFNYLGKLKVVPIGIPDKVRKQQSEKIFILNKDDYSSIIPKRSLYGHKGNYGRALIFAGSVGFTGAAFITTECTVRSGAGLTTLVCPKEIQNVMSSKLIEAMTISNDDEKIYSVIEKSDSIAVGPGMGVTEYSEKLVEKIIMNSKCNLIFDADSIRILGKRKDLLEHVKGRAIITPHPGEMAVFLNKTIEEIENNRIDTVINTAKKYNIIVLLKGYNTIISDGDKTYINTSGNSKMASGGMGDALTGLINGFCAQQTGLLNSALIGAYIHGCIADEVGRENYIVNARDIINNIPNLINSILN